MVNFTIENIDGLLAWINMGLNFGLLREESMSIEDSEGIRRVLCN